MVTVSSVSAVFCECARAERKSNLTVQGRHNISLSQYKYTVQVTGISAAAERCGTTVLGLPG